MKLLSSKEIYRNSLLSLSVEEALDPAGHRLVRAVVHHPGSAVIMPVDSRARILLVRQFRVPAKDYVWELPAGKVDPGETPLQAARRELKEETGFTARRWSKLASFYASPGFLAEKMNLYLAEDLRAGKAAPADDERIEHRWFTWAELDRGIRTGRIIDAKTMIGAMRWRLIRKR